MNKSWTTLTHPSIPEVNIKLLTLAEKITQFVTNSKRERDHLLKKINRHLIPEHMHEYDQLSEQAKVNDLPTHLELITPLIDLRYNVSEMHAIVDREMDYIIFCFEKRKEEMSFLEWTETYISSSHSTLYNIEANLEELVYDARMFDQMGALLQDNNEMKNGQANLKLLPHLRIMVEDLHVQWQSYQSFLDSGLTLFRTLLEEVEQYLSCSEDESEAEEHRDILAVIEEESEKYQVRKRLRRGGEQEANWLRNQVYRHLLTKDRE